MRSDFREIFQRQDKLSAKLRSATVRVLHHAVTKHFRSAEYETVRALACGSRTEAPANFPYDSVVSFSLYGSKELYHSGAIRNAHLYKSMFPNWGLIFFIGDSVPRQVVTALRQYPSVMCISMTGFPEDASAMFWRYLVLGWGTVKVACFRDTDSRLSPRERDAVSEWLQSSRTIHLMRDNPRHRAAILGGLWGLKAPFPQYVLDELHNFIWSRQYGDDMKFLANQIYRRFPTQILVHQDEMYFRDSTEVEVRPFPSAKVGLEFVGRGFNADESPRGDH